MCMKKQAAYLFALEKDHREPKTPIFQKNTNEIHIVYEQMWRLLLVFK